MARSYIRSSRRRKGGILVREAAVQRGVSSNSLYSIPYRANVLAGEAAGEFDLMHIDQTTSGGTLKYEAHSAAFPAATVTIANPVRIASMLVASKSPFVVKVKNSAGGWTSYEVQGQKPTKIVFSRETSVVGNPALLYPLKQKLASGTQTTALVQICSAEDAVDFQFNAVLDATND